MNQIKKPLTGTEKYVVTLMYLIGGMFLILQVISLLSTKSKVFDSAEGVISINRNELLSFLRVVATIILSFTGAILFSRKKSAGWSINLAVLIFFTLLLGSIMYANYNSVDLTLVVGFFVSLTMVSGIVFLLFRRTRIKYKVNSTSITITIVLLIFLLVFYIILQ